MDADDIDDITAEGYAGKPQLPALVRCAREDCGHYRMMHGPRSNCETVLAVGKRVGQLCKCEEWVEP